MPNSEKNKQVVGNAGLFFVCHQLSKLGWNVMPTSRNAKGIDIVAYSPDASKTIKVQVKALSEKNNVRIGKSQDDLFADYFVICLVDFDDMESEKAPVCFVLTSDEAKSEPVCKDYQGERWLQRNAFEQPQHRNKWCKIKEWSRQ